MMSGYVKTALGLYGCVMLAACAATMSAEQSAGPAAPESVSQAQNDANDNDMNDNDPNNDEAPSKTSGSGDSGSGDGAADEPAPIGTLTYDGANDDQEVICQYETETGSRFKKRVCRTKEFRDKMRRAAQEDVDRGQRPIGS